MGVGITGIYAGLTGLLLLVISYRVSKLRQKFSVGIGSGGHEELERAIRVQGNFTEYAPFILILLVFSEYQGVPSWGMHAAGVTLVVGRVLHAWGLSQESGRSFGRFVGTTVTWLLLLVLSLANIAGPWWARY